LILTIAGNHPQESEVSNEYLDEYINQGQQDDDFDEEIAASKHSNQ
jgi:hypothetical protein